MEFLARACTPKCHHPKGVGYEASKKLRSAIFWHAEKNLRQAKFKLVSRGELLRAKKLLRSSCGKPLAMLAL
jgi:hypothetical protein